MSFTRLQLTHKAAQRYEFDIENVDLSIVNGLRRTILSDIPTLGLRGEENPTITIHKNTTPLHNEFLSHRISLIRIHFSEEATEAFTDDEYTFECSLKNNSPTPLPVTTRHLTGKRNNIPLTEKELHNLFPLHPITQDPILITRLRQGEELAFTATVVKSTSAEHASFSPVSLCTFFNLPLEASQKTGLDKERDYYKNEFGEPSKMRFLLEAETALTPQYLVTKAFEILLQKVDHLYQITSTHIKPTDTPNTFEVTIPNETDTLGNILQSLLFNKYIRQKTDVSYVGYFAPHPLEKTIVLKMSIQREPTPTLEDFQALFQEGLRYVEAELKNTYTTWLNSQA